jgi:hypothetical protein
MLLGCGMLLALLDCWVLGAADAARLWDAAEVAARLLGIGCC